jgi:selenocysteine-specific elongation factor
VHDTVVLAPSGRQLHVRGLQSLGRPVDAAQAVSRVAVNLRGIEKHDVRRGDARVSPRSAAITAVVDVRLHAREEVAGELMAHVGSAALPARVRPLGPDAARVMLSAALPLRVGDRLLLRDPGRHRVVAGARVVDIAPPPLARRGAATARGRDLAAGPADPRAELRRRGIARAADLPASEDRPAPLAGDWLVDADKAAQLREGLAEFVTQHARQFPLEPGPSVEAARRALALPDRTLVDALVRTAPPLAIRDGRVVDGRREGALPPAVATAVALVRDRLAVAPFDAPEAADLARLGLGPRELAAAERVGALLRIGPGIVLLPDAAEAAARQLATLPAPFSVSQARQALATTRRVAVPLLELLDRRYVTRRYPDGNRRLLRVG